MKKRLGLFVFYDKENIVDDYVLFLLEDMRKNVTDLVIVSNSTLDIKNKNKLKQYSNKIIIRENKGLDAGALCEYFNSTKEYENYDEVVFFNDTFYGPIYPFQEVFKVMDQKKCDFWGLTLGHQQMDGWKDFEDGIIPDHLQSFFIVFRKNLLISNTFKDYWKNYDIEKQNDFKSVVTKHELRFTKYLKDKGFTYDYYIKDSNVTNYKRNYNNYANNASEQLIRNHANFLKRKNFVSSFGSSLFLKDDSDIKKAYEYVQNHTNYNTKLIWKNVLRLYKLSEVQQIFGFNEIIEEKVHNSYSSLTYFIYLNNKFLIDETLNLLNTFDGNFKIFTADQKIYNQLKENKIDVKLSRNHFQRDLLSELNHIKTKYFVFLSLEDDEKAINLVNISIGRNYLNNLFLNKNYLETLLDKLRDDNISMTYAPENYNYNYFFRRLYTDEKLGEEIQKLIPEKYTDFDHPISGSHAFIAKTELIENINFNLISKLKNEEFISFFCAIMPYLGVLKSQYPIIVFNQEYSCYKLNSMDNIIRETYKAIYKNNNYSTDYLGALNSIKVQRSERRLVNVIKRVIKEKIVFKIGPLNKLYQRRLERKRKIM